MAEDDELARWRGMASDPRSVLLDGFHAVKHALRFGARVDLVLTVDRAAALSLAAALAPDLTSVLAALLVEVEPRTLAVLAGGTHPTGVAGLARRPPPEPPGILRSAPVVLLEDPRHLGNVGAAIRVAAGLGAAAVLTTGTVDPWHPSVVRGAAGLHFALPVLRLDAAMLTSALTALAGPGGPAVLTRAGGIASLPGPLLALDAAGADIRGTAIPDTATLVFGSERRGVSADLRRRADALLALPMRPGVSSYNLATSVAMTLYHWTLYHWALTRP